MKCSLIDDFSIILAIPPQPILAPFWSRLLKHDANRISEADGIVRSIGGQEKHFAFTDRNISVFAVVYDLEKHGAAVLVEPFRGFVDVEIGARIGTANDLLSRQHDQRIEVGIANHDGHIIIVDAVIVDRWFQKMRVFFEPASTINWVYKDFRLICMTNEPFRQVERR